MDEIRKTNPKLNAMRIQYTMAFAEWIGENNLTYDGYKIWTRPPSKMFDGNYTNKYLSGPVTYNTEQLIEQYFRENP